MKARKSTARDKRRAEFVALLLELDRLDQAACKRFVVECAGKVRS